MPKLSRIEPSGGLNYQLVHRETSFQGQDGSIRLIQAVIRRIDFNVFLPLQESIASFSIELDD